MTKNTTTCYNFPREELSWFENSARRLLTLLLTRMFVPIRTFGGTERNSLGAPGSRINVFVVKHALLLISALGCTTATLWLFV